MRFYIDGTTDKTEEKPPVIDYVEAIKDGKVSTYTWDESEFGVTDGNYEFRGKGVSVDNDATGEEEYMNGRIDELKDCDHYYICIVDADDEGRDMSFECTSFIIEDDDEKYEVPLEKISKEEL